MKIYMFYLLNFNSMVEFTGRMLEFTSMIIKHVDGAGILPAFVIVLSSIVLAKLLKYVVVGHFKRLAAKTKTEIDDILISMVSKPLYYLVIFVGFYLASRSVSAMIPYFEKLEVGFFVIGVIIGAWMVTKVVSLFVILWLEKEKGIERVPEVISKTVSIFVFTLAILMILDYFNIALSPLVATLGVGGIAIGLALQSTLSDFFAGMHIMSDKPLRVGDFIELEDGTTGYVDDIGWRSTKIRTRADYSVIIPNSKLAQSKIINYSMPVKQTNVIINCGVAYDSDLEKVEKVTLEVARKVQKNLKECDEKWEPRMRFYNFGESNIEFRVILRAKDFAYRYKIMDKFIKELKKQYDKEGIEISWPVRKIYFGERLLDEL